MMSRLVSYANAVRNFVVHASRNFFVAARLASLTALDAMPGSDKQVSAAGRAQGPAFDSARGASS